MEIERIGDAVYALGENPLWDAAAGALYWIDSLAPAIHRWEPAAGAVREWRLPGRTVGSMALREGGGAVLAMDDGFNLFDFDTGGCTAVAVPESGEPRTRFNDGKVDARGRFLAGSAHVDFAEPLGALWRLDPNGSCTRLDTGFRCANGPCWSPDGATLYVADSDAHVIYAYAYDPDSGAAADRRTFVSTAELGSQPDGATVDAAGDLWSAQFGGGGVLRIAPSGRVVDRVELPVRWVSSVAFGGPGLDVLYVTSIGGVLGGARDASPQAGAVFAVHGLGAAGRPEPRYRG